MAKSCGDECAEYFFSIAGFLLKVFFLAPAAVLAAGLWLRFDPRITAYTSSNSAVYASLELATAVHTAWAIFIAFGTFIFVVGFCVCCCGSEIRSSKRLLGVYIAIIATIIAGELGGGIYAYAKFSSVMSSVNDTLRNDTMYNYPLNRSLINDDLMTQLHCCGWNNFADFNVSLSRPLPKPCCSDPTMYPACKAAALVSLDPGSIILPGCETVMATFLGQARKVFIGVGIGTAALELLVLISATFLCCSIHSRGPSV